MDENLQKYLDQRFNTIDHRLSEIETKIDVHADRMTSVERDYSHVERRISLLETDDRAVAERCLTAQLACRDIVEKSTNEKIRSAVASVKGWVAIGVATILLTIVGYFFVTSIIEPVRNISSKQVINK